MSGPVAMGAGHPNWVRVDKGDLADPPVRSRWTRVDEYFAGLARRRSARRQREPDKPRTQPEQPRFALSTLPFLALILGLAVLAIAFFITAWPGKEPPNPPPPQPREFGAAPPGWLERAEKEMRGGERRRAGSTTESSIGAKAKPSRE